MLSSLLLLPFAFATFDPTGWFCKDRAQPQYTVKVNLNNFDVSRTSDPIIGGGLIPRITRDEPETIEITSTISSQTAEPTTKGGSIGCYFQINFHANNITTPVTVSEFYESDSPETFSDVSQEVLEELHVADIANVDYTIGKYSESRTITIVKPVLQ